MRLTKFSNGDPSARVKVRLLSGSKEIGYIISTANSIIDNRSYEVKKGKSGAVKGQGSIHFKDFQLLEVPSFVDYLRGGWQISLAVAIDFTASNGNPLDQRSLHFSGPQNQYYSAISQVGAILESYDANKMFPTFGFGGVWNGSGVVSHCHPLNGNPS